MIRARQNNADKTGSTTVIFANTYYKKVDFQNYVIFLTSKILNFSDTQVSDSNNPKKI
jgi:hypothetical protein